MEKYQNIITTTDVVLTDERRNHIYEQHILDYEIIIKNLKNTIMDPKEILEDFKNDNTIFVISKIFNKNLNVIIKLNVINDYRHPKNSIMTAWIVRDSNLKKLRKKNKIIYKKE